MTALAPIWAALWHAATPGGWTRPFSSRELLLTEPSTADFRQAIPCRASSVLATARRASDDRPLTRQLRDAVAAAGLITVGTGRSARRLVVDRDTSIVRHVSDALALGAVSGIVLCGPPRANQKPVVQLHDRAGRTVAYVKVAWNDLTRRLLDAEAGALTHLASVGTPGFVVPPVLGRGTFAEATWLAIGPVGVDRRRPPTAASTDAVAVAIERTGTPSTAEAAASPYVTALRERAAGLAAGEPLVEQLVERHGGVELPLAAYHGDFVPWNLLTGAPAPAVWDWERYDPAVPVGFDRLHVRLQVAVHRAGRTVDQADAALRSELDTILPELAPAQRAAHLGWYLAELLCRYERDAGDHPTPRLVELVDQITHVLKGRHTSS